MAIEIAQAYVSIVPSMKNVGNAITAAFGGASEKIGRSEGGKLGAAFGGGLKARMGAAIGVASAVAGKAMSAIGSSISSAVSRADQMNNFPKVMRNLGYSSEDAAKSIRKITASLDGLPTTSSAMTSMVQQLAPLTSNLDEATTISLAFNNAMLAGGASTMEQENALTQYTQMLSAGKVDMQAWRSIQAAMPGQLNQVAEAMMGAGHNANDLYEAMKDGTYSFDDFNKAIVNLNDNGFGQYASFAQQAKDATQGIGTAIENVKNRVAKAVQKVVEAFGVENIAGAINGFSSQFGKIGDAAANMVTLTKNQLADLWSKVQDTGALDTLKTAWDGLTAKLSGTDWGRLLPANVWEQLKNTAASALADIMDRVSQLIGWLSAGIQWVSDFVSSFANTGVFQAWIDVLGVVCDIVQSTWDAFSSVIDVFGRMTGAAGGAQSFGATVGNALRNIANAITPVLRALDSLIGWFTANPNVIIAALGGIGAAFAGVKGYQALSNGLQVLTGTMGAVANGARNFAAGIELMKEIGGPVAMIKELGSNLKIVSAAQQAWSSVTKAATAVQTAFNVVLDANPIGLIITAIAAVVAALTWFFTQTEVGRKAWAAFTSWLSNTWNSVVSTAKSVWGSISGFFSGLWSQISGAAQAAWNGITGFLTGVWNNITQAVSSAFNNVRNIIVNVFTVIGGAIVAPLEMIRNAISTVFGWILQFIQTQMNSTNSVWSTVWTAIYNVVSTVFNMIQTYVGTAVNAVRTVIVTVIQLLQGDWQGAWTTISTFFMNIWNGITAFFAPVVSGIQSTISNALAAISGVWNSVWGAISGFVSGIWGSITSAVSGGINRVSGVISGVMGSIRGIWSGAWNGISSMMSGIWNGITGAVRGGVSNVLGVVRGIGSQIRGVFSGAGSWLVNAGTQIVQGLVNGIKGMIGNVVSTVKNMASSALEAAKSFLHIHSPSRVFRDQVGAMIGAGLVVGLEQSEKPVQAAAEAMLPDIGRLSIDTGVTELANKRTGYRSTTPDTNASNLSVARRDERQATDTKEAEALDGIEERLARLYELLSAYLSDDRPFSQRDFARLVRSVV